IFAAAAFAVFLRKNDRYQVATITAPLIWPALALLIVSMPRYTLAWTGGGRVTAFAIEFALSIAVLLFVAGAAMSLSPRRVAHAVALSAAALAWTYYIYSTNYYAPGLTTWNVFNIPTRFFRGSSDPTDFAKKTI